MRHVLLSNDDGYRAPGIRALLDAFLAAGWRVTLAAPVEEQSATSHSITISRPLVAWPVQFDGVPADAPLSAYRIDGRPADCVKLALLELCDEKPDLIVSGINDGWNAGTDVHYSGTFGAAMEAAFEGFPAIAISIHRPNSARLQNAAQVAVRFADRLLAHPLPPFSVLNINLPNCEPEEIRGVCEAPLTCIKYSDKYHSLVHGSGKRMAYWLSGQIIEEQCAPNGDLHKLLEGYVTLSAIHWDMTMQGALDALLQDH